MIDLYNGDCFCVIEDFISKGLKFDCIISDPPYGMSYVSSRRKEKYDKILLDDNLDWLPDFYNLTYNVLSDNSIMYLFCSHHHIDVFVKLAKEYFTYKNILVWVKNNFGMGDLKGDFAPQTEYILFLKKGNVNIKGKRISNVLYANKTNNILHPTQKPVDLLETLIGKFTQENDLILDPFMGSGSTGVACLNINRNFTGIELDKNYFNLASDRLNNHIIPQSKRNRKKLF